jgi:hypothetical protein
VLFIKCKHLSFVGNCCIDYSVDLDAQMRDQLSVDPNRNLDRGMNEYGGGIYE